VWSSVLVELCLGAVVDIVAECLFEFVGLHIGAGVNAGSSDCFWGQRGLEWGFVRTLSMAL
jgi:hypothetical protein